MASLCYALCFKKNSIFTTFLLFKTSWALGSLEKMKVWNNFSPRSSFTLLIFHLCANVNWMRLSFLQHCHNINLLSTFPRTIRNAQWSSHTKIILTFLFLWPRFYHCHGRPVSGFRYVYRLHTHNQNSIEYLRFINCYGRDNKPMTFESFTDFHTVSWISYTLVLILNVRSNNFLKNKSFYNWACYKIGKHRDKKIFFENFIFFYLVRFINVWVDKKSILYF